MTARAASPVLVRLVAYYGVLAGAAVLIGPRLPAVRAPTSDAAIALAAAMAMVGALLLVIPVAWIYMRTKTWRYDASLVHTVIILPVAVAGIVLIIRDSLALAFSLAGIVAAVRFRNTLKDTKDAVYIFIAIALGLAAGVQAFSAAYVMSLMFVLLVLALWRFDVGTDPARVAGVLVAEGAYASAGAAIADVLDRRTKRWRLLYERATAGDRATLTYVVRLRPRTSPDALVADVQSAAGAGAAVRFEPPPPRRAR